MVRTLVASVGDASIVVNVLAGAGLGTVAGQFVADRARRRGFRQIDPQLIVSRFSFGGAVVGLGAELLTAALR
ncbi:MAG: hypothetical protein QOJ38_1913 [Solirubrobacterales bacterium]|jgi:hypothetical protein|nr:hypothetical protein [Solirubrobacterales bacterium]